MGVELSEPISGAQGSIRRVCIVGGAGFIGSHFTRRFLADPATEQVTIFDNFSSGRMWHLDDFLDDGRLNIVRGDVKDLPSLAKAVEGHDRVVHLASNPDISKAMSDPTIDFYEGTFLTNQVLEAMRTSGVKRILYASGSGVYGDLGDRELDEDFSPMMPSSTYGASKLAGEALIASYCAMFEMSGCAFRFGNVVGPRQTHGVGYDFVLRLLANPSELRILGDGTQSKPYIYVDDVISAVLTADQHCEERFQPFNVAPGDYLSVNEIADIAKSIVLGADAEVEYVYSGGDRGWKGDVPVVRLNTSRIRKLGWQNRYSAKEAMAEAIEHMRKDAVLGKLGGGS